MAQDTPDIIPHSTWTRKRIVFLGCVVLAWLCCAVWYLLPPSPAVVERFYSLGLYRAEVYMITPLTQWTPFSINLALMMLSVLGFIGLWIGRWIYLRRVKRRSHWIGLFWGPKWFFLLLPFNFIAFLALWGAGYERVPVDTRLHLDTATITDTESGQLRGMLLDIIKRDIPPPESRDVSRAVAATAQAMEEVVAEWDGRPVTVPRRVKAFPKGFLLFNGTSGMCSPLTLEAQVDGALPDATFVSVAAHELGHVAGFCREDEATLIGLVSGLRANDPLARYACALSAYVALLPAKGTKEAFNALPEMARNDLKKAQEISRRYRNPLVTKLSWKVYNKYLQSQGIKEGVKNYDRGILLFAGAWRKGLTALPK